MNHLSVISLGSSLCLSVWVVASVWRCSAVADAAEATAGEADWGVASTAGGEAAEAAAGEHVAGAATGGVVLATADPWAGPATSFAGGAAALTGGLGQDWGVAETTCFDEDEAVLAGAAGDLAVVCGTTVVAGAATREAGLKGTQALTEAVLLRLVSGGAGAALTETFLAGTTALSLVAGAAEADFACLFFDSTFGATGAVDLLSCVRFANLRELTTTRSRVPPVKKLCCEFKRMARHASHEDPPLFCKQSADDMCSPLARLSLVV
jgi:hypothetical protein